jgi:hypothetical protein
VWKRVPSFSFKLINILIKAYSHQQVLTVMPKKAQQEKINK